MTTHVPPRFAPSGELLSLESALARMLEGVAPLPAETVALGDALGRVLAEAVESRLTLPPWDNSAMDGFAVRAADLTGATAERPVGLRVVGESAAGHPARLAVEPGTCVRILTGAPMPDGGDAVVPVEEVLPVDETDGGGSADAVGAGRDGHVTVGFSRTPAPGAHIRRAGSDLRPGYPLVAGGEMLGPAALAVCAAGGYGAVAVHRRPSVAILATGDELAEPGAQLGEAQIPDSNTVGLLGQAREAGAEARTLGIASDDLEKVLGRLRPALAWADLVVVSGGVSVGLHDVVKEAFASVGRLDLWRVAVQPGKPLAFARAPRADSVGEVLLFGLPGNPVSSFVTFELFVRPVLRRLSGLADLSGRETVRARLGEPVAKAPGRRAFLRVRLERDRGGERQAWLAGGQGSHVLSALVAADGLAVIPEEREALEEGAEVEVILLRPRPVLL